MMADAFRPQADVIAIDTGVEVVRTLRRLTARVDWLEQRFRESGDLPTAALDLGGQDLDDLAEAVFAGRDAQECLLDAGVRERLAADLDEFARLELERDEAAENVMTIGKVLQATRRDDPLHLSHAERFSAAERRLAVATEVVRGRQAAARSSAARLVDDDERGTALAPLIEAGRRADADLATLLRDLVQAEVERHALMPAWFADALGHAPGWAVSGSEWLEVAALVLAYRVVYEVSDGQEALGAEPAAGPRKHQFDEFQRLRGVLKGLG